MICFGNCASPQFETFPAKPAWHPAKIAAIAEEVETLFAARGAQAPPKTSPALVETMRYQKII
jgi:hypothetical protein